MLSIQGSLTTALYLIGVPYALALDGWVSIAAVIPYRGACHLSGWKIDIHGDLIRQQGGCA